MDHGYIAYVEEAGDPGLSKVRPIDPEGASEWLVLSAVVLRASRESQVVDWVDRIRAETGITRRRALHYRDLSPTRKVAVASAMAELPMRAFALCSNKKNMRGYQDPRAANIRSKQSYYNWCVRLLLERVTTFCNNRTLSDHGERRPIKIEFSRRGGHRYSQARAYQHFLGHRPEGDPDAFRERQPVTQMLSTELMENHSADRRAGLQLADAVAGAFHQASDTLSTGKWQIEPARALAPIMAKELGSWRDFGVTLLPTVPWKARLTPEQKQIFHHYGYDFGRW